MSDKEVADKIVNKALAKVRDRKPAPIATNDKDKATAKRVIKRYLDNDTNDFQLENEFIAALTTVREEAREAAFRDAVAVIMKRGEIIHRGNLVKAIEAAANDAEGAGDG